MLREIRRNYHRLVAFLLSLSMIITNVGVNAGTVFAAENQEEREESIFMVDGLEILEAIQDVKDKEAFSKEELEEMELSGQKGVVKKYEKLLLPEEGKVYELELDIDTDMVLEGTALQVFYNEKTKEVVFLYLNESNQPVDCYVNIDGYETKRVTVKANDNIVSSETDTAAAEEENEESANGNSEKGSNNGSDNRGSFGNSDDSSSGGSSEADESSDVRTESASDESAAPSESNGEFVEDDGKEETSSAGQTKEAETEDSSDKVSEDEAKDDEFKAENDEEGKGQAEDKPGAEKDDSEKADQDNKEAEDSKPEDGNTDKEASNIGNSGEPNVPASGDEGSGKDDSAKEENTNKADNGSETKDDGKSEEEHSKEEDTDKTDTSSSKETGKVSDKSDSSSTGEASAKSDDEPAREKSSEKADNRTSDRSEDKSSDEGKAGSDSSDSNRGSSDDGENRQSPLSMSKHQVAIAAVPADEVGDEVEAEAVEETAEEIAEEGEMTAAVEKETAAVEETKKETEVELKEESTAVENIEVVQTGTVEQYEEIAETLIETETAAEAETTEVEKVSEVEADVKELEAETAEETTEKVEETSGEVTESEEDFEVEESVQEVEEPESSRQDISSNSENDNQDNQEITDDWEIPGKAYDTVTIRGTINARAYCVALEDVQKILEANREVEAEEVIESDLITAKTYTAETDDAEFTVSVPEGAFTEDVELNVVKIEEKEQLEKLAQQADAATSQDKAVSGVLAYDITFISAQNGLEVEPLQAVEVNISLKNTAVPENIAEKEATEVSIIHLPENNEAEVVAETQNIQATEFEFQAKNFSKYVLTYTTDADARTDENSFATLQAAVNYVKDGATIYLLDNVTENIESSGKSYILDMRGHTVNGGDKKSVFSFTNAGAVTLKNGTITKGKGSSSSKAGGITANGVSLELDQVTIRDNTTTYYSGGVCALYAKNTTLKVSACIIEENNSKKSKSKAISVDNSTSEFVGGKIINNECGMCGGIYQEKGKLSIKGTVIKANSAQSGVTAAGGYYGNIPSGEVKMESGAIYNNKCGDEIRDIMFYSQNPKPVTIGIIPANQMSDADVGGDEYFSESGYNYKWVGKDWCDSDGDIVISNTDAGIKSEINQYNPNYPLRFSGSVSYSAQPDSGAKPNYVAQADEIKYFSLQSAVESVNDGTQITLLPNVENPEVPVSDEGNIEIKKQITLKSILGNSIVNRQGRVDFQKCVG